MVMDGSTLDVGSVGYLRRIKNAVGVARAVMQYSTQTLLSGEGATEFAKMMGFPEETLSTPHSEQMYEQWVNSSCQPNYWQNVVNQTTQCPPYQPLPMPYTKAMVSRPPNAHVSQFNHDTIGMIVSMMLLACLYPCFVVIVAPMCLFAGNRSKWSNCGEWQCVKWVAAFVLELVWMAVYRPLHLQMAPITRLLVELVTLLS
jgi:Asparaginase